MARSAPGILNAIAGQRSTYNSHAQLHGFDAPAAAWIVMHGPAGSRGAICPKVESRKVREPAIFAVEAALLSAHDPECRTRPLLPRRTDG